MFDRFTVMRFSKLLVNILTICKRMHIYLLGLNHRVKSNNYYAEEQGWVDKGGLSWLLIAKVTEILSAKFHIWTRPKYGEITAERIIQGTPAHARILHWCQHNFITSNSLSVVLLPYPTSFVLKYWLRNWLKLSRARSSMFTISPSWKTKNKIVIWTMFFEAFIKSK